MLPELSSTAQQWINAVFFWLGVGIFSGIAAKTLLPGRHPAGAVGTLLVGSLGSVIGPLLLSLFLDRKIANPINPFGLVAAVGGAVLLLAGYRLLIKWLTAGPQPEPEEA